METVLHETSDEMREIMVEKRKTKALGWCQVPWRARGRCWPEGFACAPKHGDEGKEDMSFVPSAVSDSAQWHEPKFMCDRQGRKGGFKFCDIAARINC